MTKKPHLKTVLSKLRKKVDEKGETSSQSTSSQLSSQSSSSNEAEIPSHASYTAGFISGKQIPYVLHDSFILDSGATIHICNDRQRFEDFVLVSESVYAGEGQVQVQGFGTVRINIDRPSGKLNIKLAQVAFIPNFQTNTVSFRRLKTKGIEWDTENNNLTQGGKIWCKVQDKYDQFVIEFQPVAAFPADSRAPRSPLKGTIERWHQRMGHLHEEAIKKLPQSVNGVVLDQSKSIGTCEVCRTSQAPQKISRRTPERATRPFQKVHFDLIQLNEGYNHDNWAIHFLEDLSRFNFVYTMHDKGETTAVVKEFKALVKRQFKYDIEIFHTDGETSLGNDFNNWKASEGIIIEKLAPYTQA